MGMNPLICEFVANCFYDKCSFSAMVCVFTNHNYLFCFFYDFCILNIIGIVVIS